MNRSRLLAFLCNITILMIFLSCTQEKTDSSKNLNRETVQDSTHRILTIKGFSGPEAVRYDPDQDIYFVSNFNGGGNDRDANGFISKVSTGGTIDSLRFMIGTESAPLHAPRGMFITGNTLWAVDIDGVHKFNRYTGKQTGFIDFSSFEPGFLNDIVQSSEGSLYITDTGKSRLFKIVENRALPVKDSLAIAPNGIARVPESDELVLAPWGEKRTFLQWNTQNLQITTFGRAETGGNFDGMEFINGKLLAASQQDSSLHLITKDQDHLLIQVPGRPADIGVDTKRRQVAVPYIALDRVDIWQLQDN